MTMIAETTRRFFGSALGLHMFQDCCEHGGQKYVAQTLLSVPASSAILHRRHINRMVIHPAIKFGTSA